MAITKLSTSGILDFAKYRSMLAGNTAFSPGSYDLLETEILTGTTASVTFSSLGSYAADYQHLQIRWVAGNTNTGTDMDNVKLNFNADTGANYSSHRLLGSGSSVNSYAASNASYCFGGIVARGSSVIPAANIVDILDWQDTNKYTTVRVLQGGTNTSQNLIGLVSGSWRNTATITSLTLAAESGDSFRIGGRFSLYGLKAA